jgi:hypothetical protein
MSKRPQDTSAEEPDGGNPHIRFRGGLRLGDRPGLLNRWTQRGPHLLLQTRVQVLNDNLRNTFCRWFPGMMPDGQAPLKAA